MPSIDEIARLAAAPVPDKALDDSIEKLVAELAADAYCALRGGALGRDAGHSLAQDFADDIEEMLRVYFRGLAATGDLK